jgi:hypothetical protein
MDQYTHLQAHDHAGALDLLPKLPDFNPSADDKQEVRATGTEGGLFSRLDRALTTPMRFDATTVTTAETGSEGKRPAATEHKSLAVRMLAPDRAGMTTGEIEEAPPGFEPGMADLQSAALPLG